MPQRGPTSSLWKRALTVRMSCGGISLRPRPTSRPGGCPESMVARAWRRVAWAPARSTRPSSSSPDCGVCSLRSGKRGWDLELPFFPDEQGGVVAKDVMTATIREAGRRLKVKASSADGSEKLTGHSLRVTGAQGLARAGLEVWAIQLLGRWGSQTVLDYVREVPLEHSRLWAARAAKLSAIDDVLRNPAIAASRTSTSSASSSSSLSAPCQGPLEREALAQAIGEAKEAADVHALPLSDSRFLNCPGGKWHRIPKTGMLGASSSWTAACGWRFAGSLASLARGLPPRVCHKFCGLAASLTSVIR